MGAGGFFKALGRGAKAVGRGIASSFKDEPDGPKADPLEGYTPVSDEFNDEYTGYSKGVADLDMPSVESDGLMDESYAMEAPPDIGGYGEEALIGMSMPNLPGFKGKARGGGVRAGVGGGVKIEAPKKSPTAYETVIGGQANNFPMGLSAPGAGMILDTEDSLSGSVLRTLRGDGPDAAAQYAHDRENPQGVNLMAMPGYVTMFMPRSTAGAQSIPGLTGPKRIAGSGQRQLETSGPPGFTMPGGGSGPTWQGPKPKLRITGGQRQLPGAITP